MTTQSLLDVARAVLGQMLITIYSYLKKQEKTFNRQQLETEQQQQQQQQNPKISRRKEIIKI